MRADGSSTMRGSNGQVVSIENSDMTLSADGKMVVKNMDEGRRLAGSSGNVATERAGSTKMLHSALADSFFEALDELTVLSARGHYLTLKIHGFARIPVLNSRCGNIVHLFTSWGPRVTLDSDDLSFDKELTNLFENAGFEVDTGGVAGRRLAGGAAAVNGLFNHISSMG